MIMITIIMIMIMIMIMIAIIIIITYRYADNYNIVVVKKEPSFTCLEGRGWNSRRRQEEQECHHPCCR